jgi:hypothetical protein
MLGDLAPNARDEEHGVAGPNKGSNVSIASAMEMRRHPGSYSAISVY